LEVGITYHRMLCNDFTGPARFRLNMPEMALELKRVWHPWSKAFDTLDHEILLWKLEQFYGIRGLPHELLTSYLQDRQQYTVVGGYRSTSRG